MAEDLAKQKAEEEARTKAAEKDLQQTVAEAEASVKRAETRDPEAAKAQRRVKPEVKRQRRSKDEPRRRMQGKLTIGDALRQAEDGDEGRVRSLAAIRRAKEREKKRQREELQKGELQVKVREVVIPETISVSNLANRMATRAADGESPNEYGCNGRC